MKERRGFTRNFKLSVLNALNVKRAAEVCREYNIHPNMLSRWKREFNQDPAKAFSGRGNLWKAEAEVERYKKLVGELYAEIDFLTRVRQLSF